MNALTLKYGATEQSIDAWGFSDPILVYRSRAAGTFEITAYGADPAAQAAAPTIPFGGLVIIKDSGTVIFVGKRRDMNGDADGDKRNVRFVFKDAWDSLERTIYQMQWTNPAGGTVYSSRCFLFQNLGNSTTPWANWKTSDQITDVINFAQTQCGIPIQAGTIDPVMYQPVYPCRAPSCADVIRLALQSCPDAVTYFDYTTTSGGSPAPTLHIRQRRNCTVATLPWGDGVKHTSSKIKSREDLVVPQVVFQYQQSTLSGGVYLVTPGTDAYPIGSTGLAENSQVAPIDLRGSVRNIVSGVVVASAFSPGTAAYWSDKDNTLADASISSLAVLDATINGGGGHPTGVTVVDTTGTAIDLTTYPNEMKPGQIAPWMLDPANTQLKVIEARVVAHVSYIKNYPGTTNKTDQVDDHIVSTRIYLTNSPVGTTTYSAQASGTAAEVPLPNLAYLFWCYINNTPINAPAGVITPPGSPIAINNAYNLQWEGDHTITEQTISTYYTPFNVLCLSGGATAWASMNAQIYEIEYDFFQGQTKLRFGPFRHLGQEQFFAQAMSFTTRIAWDNPNVRNTGFDPAGAGVQLGKETRLQDTASTAQPVRSVHTVNDAPDGSGLQFQIKQDVSGSGPLLQMGTVNSVGALQSGGSNPASLVLPLSALGDGEQISFFKYEYLDSDCNPKWRWMVGGAEHDGTP